MVVKGNKKNARKRSRQRKNLLDVRAKAGKSRVKRMAKLVSFIIPLLAVLALGWFLVAGGGYLVRKMFTSNDHYTINNIDIESDGRLTPELIREYGGVEKGMNLFALDVGKVRNDLENVPLVREAEVARALPSTLRIRISERVPLARISDESGRYQMSVDREGFLLTPARRRESLPTISGLRLSDLKPGRLVEANLFQDALEVLDICDKTRLSKFIDIENIDISDTDTMEVRLETGEYVIMPRRNIRTKLVKLANILNECRLNGRRLAKIDLTVANVAPAVEYR